MDAVDLSRYCDNFKTHIMMSEGRYDANVLNRHIKLTKDVLDSIDVVVTKVKEDNPKDDVLNAMMVEYINNFDNYSVGQKYRIFVLISDSLVFLLNEMLVDLLGSVNEDNDHIINKLRDGYSNYGKMHELFISWYVESYPEQDKLRIDLE